ncbi:2-dehydro-3-deoxy-D-gluconate 5-dehydrogenase [Myxococcaceae bacterium]|nr:2-dehydro-3-deoxy-D-gluconate 5-dehydrogenase [Myxococcaceae bacterium]
MPLGVETRFLVLRDRFSLAGRTALVTGASRGIGRSIAIAFAEQGADLVLSSRKADALEAVATEIAALGRRAIVIPAHVGREDSIDALADRIEREAIAIDVLVNNAAVNPVMAGVLDLDPGAWRKVIDANVTGSFLLTRRIARGMVERGRGAIVNVASVGGLRVGPGLAAYDVSKAALIHLTRALAVELGPRGVRANAIAPGLVETRMAEALFRNEAGYRAYVSSNPLRRHGQPDEIAAAALFLASDAGSYTNGEVLVVDGGSVI